MNHDLHKEQTRKQWNATPCGTGDYLTGIEYGSLEFFDAVRQSRYADTDQWMPKFIPFDSARGKKVLEIGHGMGTDLLTFADVGAEVYGIDITEEHHRLAKQNLALHGHQGVLKLCDASSIDFPSNTFDIVYSHGVLHHTPDTVRCFGEAYRVLKPGGKFMLGMYYRYSAFHLFHLVGYLGIMRRKLRKLGYAGLMSLVETGADGINVKPLVKTYTRAQLRHMLADFSSVEFRIAHFKREHIPVVGRWVVPRAMERVLEPKLGWYLLATATK